MKLSELINILEELKIWYSGDIDVFICGEYTVSPVEKVEYEYNDSSETKRSITIY